MDDLLKIQIHENCRISIPEGLKDLMSDISREVLRAQPKDLLGFITGYLSSLLVTRENLSIASRLCDSTCKYKCAAGLEDELKYLGLSPEDVETVTKIVNKHLAAATSDKTFEEGNLLQKLLLRTSISVELVPEIQMAVRKTFLRHQSHLSAIYGSSSDEELDDVSRAVRHTMELYRKTNPTDDEFHRKSVKIQAAYRAYGIKRELAKATSNKWSYADDVIAHAPLSSKELRFDDLYGEIKDTKEEKPMLEGEVALLTDSDNTSDRTEVILRNRMSSLYSVSSASLAGSFLQLPKLVPYSVHNIDALTETEEDFKEDYDEENTVLNYTEEACDDKKQCNDLRKLFVGNAIQENDEESEINEEIYEKPNNSRYFNIPENVINIPNAYDDYDVDEEEAVYMD